MNISLEAPTEAHAAWWLALRRAPETQRFNPIQEVELPALSRRLRMSTCDLSRRDATEHMWIICLDGEPVGTASLKGHAWTMGYASVGYAVSPSHHGRGIGTRAIGLVVDRVFEQTPLHRLMASIATENVPSRRLVERLGFKLEGVFREHFVIQGRRIDQAQYALLRPDWEALQRQRVEIRGQAT